VEKKLVLLTYGVYIGVALYIAYRVHDMEDLPTNQEILSAVENGAANIVREQETAAAEQAATS
jgi:hypothetical protein